MTRLRPFHNGRALLLGGILMLGAAFRIPVASAPAVTLRAGQAASFAVKNARIFDGHQLRRGAVLVEGGKIQAIGVSVKVPAGVAVIDGTGDTLLPGLIDSHTHGRSNAELKQALIFGVTTELGMFNEYHFAAQIREEQARGEDLDVADLRSAGILATAPGGHGTQYDLPIPTLSKPEEAQAFVEARIAEGSDYIKIVSEDLNRSVPTLSNETIAALIAAAHTRKKLAVIHITKQQNARDAIAEGVDGLAHLFIDTEPAPDFGKFAAAHRIFVIPTLTVLQTITGQASGKDLPDDARLAPYLSPANIKSLRSTYGIGPLPLKLEFAEHAVRQLKAAGVPILAGTDTNNPGSIHGASIHREMEMLVHAGLTPAEALTAATAAPARAFRLGDRGEIAVGKRADLLLVKGDPTTDILATRDIVAVWKLGVQADRASFKDELEREREGPSGRP